MLFRSPTAKLAPRRHGPFPISQVMSPVTYRLELPKQWSIHPVFHTDLLTPYRETTLHGDNYQHPPPDLIDGEEEYEVEAILDSRKFGRTKRQQYLVKWKGYPDSDNQWLDKGDIFTEDAIREFKRRHPTKEAHIKTLREQAKSPVSSLLPMTTSSDNYPGLDVDTPSIQVQATPTLDAIHQELAEELAEARAHFPTPTPG